MQSVKVLVVDDNKRIVSLLKEALNMEEEIEVVGESCQKCDYYPGASVLIPQQTRTFDLM